MKKMLFLAALTLLAATGASSPARAADEAVIGEVLAILKERGIVDEARYDELIERNKAYEAKQASLLSKMLWTGDFRGRFESFWFDEDPAGERDNRHRARYRLRIGAKVPVNEWLTAGFRLASGESENRSTNRTLGAGDDFDRDAIGIDEAYVGLKLPIEVGSTSATFGKQSNPFLWKHGKDYMVWDGDYSLEGVALQWAMQPSSAVGLFGNSGYFIIDENGGTKDPHFFGLQGGAQLQATESLAFGGRVTWFSYGSLNAGFFARQAEFGNLGLSDSADGSFDQIEVSGFGRASFSDRWPVLLHAHFARNLDAANLPGEGKQDTGWGIGLEIGDAKQVALLGLGYYELEADFAPALYIDSDLTDGFTNRKGWTFFGTRQVFSNTELTLELFLSDALESTPLFLTSLDGSERYRLRTDVVVKF